MAITVGTLGEMTGPEGPAAVTLMEGEYPMPDTRVAMLAVGVQNTALTEETSQAAGAAGAQTLLAVLGASRKSAGTLSGPANRTMVGACVGEAEGFLDGEAEGLFEGARDGGVGEAEGLFEGRCVGAVVVGLDVVVGRLVGRLVGEAEGLFEGARDGEAEDGARDGEAEGLFEGRCVGAVVASATQAHIIFRKVEHSWPLNACPQYSLTALPVKSMRFVVHPSQLVPGFP